MQDQPIGPDGGAAHDEVEREVLALLMDSRSAQELGLEIGNDLVATDAVMRLHAAGLVHLCDGFVWPTWPAVRLHRLIERQ